MADYRDSYHLHGRAQTLTPQDIAGFAPRAPCLNQLIRRQVSEARRLELSQLTEQVLRNLILTQNLLAVAFKR